MLTPGTSIPRSAYEAQHRARIGEDPILAGITTGDISPEIGASVPLTHDDVERYAAVIAPHVRYATNQILVDLGCGTGGPGYLISQRLGMHTLGIDWAETACRGARERYGVHGSILSADFTATPLRAAGAAAIVSFDGMYLSDQREALLRECHRVLLPGAPLFFTILDEGETITGWSRNLYDAGFSVVSTADATDQWRRLMRIRHEGRWARRTEIAASLGARGVAALSVTRQMLGHGCETSLLERLKRTEVLAVRPV